MEMMTDGTILELRREEEEEEEEGEIKKEKSREIFYLFFYRM